MTVEWVLLATSLNVIRLFEINIQPAQEKQTVVNRWKATLWILEPMLTLQPHKLISRTTSDEIDEQRVPLTVFPVLTEVPPTVHANVLAASGPRDELALIAAVGLPT